MLVKFFKEDQDAKFPERKHLNDAGIDLFSLFEYKITRHSFLVVRTGIRLVELPKNTFAFITNKSKNDFMVGAGVVDEGYRGEILVKLLNPTHKVIEIPKHFGIAQLVVIPIYYPQAVEVDYVGEKTTRGVTGGIVTQLDFTDDVSWSGVV